MEFLRRFLEHVLPSGFAKVRHYGFLSPAAAVSLELVRRLIGVWLGEVSAAASGRAGSPSSAPSVGPTCPSCGGRLVRLGFEPAVGLAVFDTS